MKIKELNEAVIAGNIPMQLGSWKAGPGDTLYLRTPDMKYLEIEFGNYTTDRADIWDGHYKTSHVDIWEMIPYEGSNFKYGRNNFRLGPDFNWGDMEIVGLIKCVSYDRGNCWHSATYRIYYTETDNFYEYSEPTEPEHHGSYCARWSKLPLDEKAPRYDDLGLEKGYIYTSFHDSSD